MKRTFYKRALRSDQVDFRSSAGRDLLRAALDAGTAGPFFRLIANLHTQGEPSWCGLGTLVTVLNALEIDPEREWKGPWRWFGEELLDCCTTLEDATANGLTLEEVATIARCNGAEVDVGFAESDALDAFRAALVGSMATDAEVLAVAYHRGELGQTGAGHYSPLGAWEQSTDRVLILDVARFKYPPHWATVSSLWGAMQRVDEVTGRPRGWLALRATGSTPCRADVEKVCCRLSALGADAPALPALQS